MALRYCKQGTSRANALAAIFLADCGHRRDRGVQNLDTVFNFLRTRPAPGRCALEKTENVPEPNHWSQEVRAFCNTAHQDFAAGPDRR